MIKTLQTYHTCAKIAQHRLQGGRRKAGRAMVPYYRAFGTSLGEIAAAMAESKAGTYSWRVARALRNDSVTAPYRPLLTSCLLLSVDQSRECDEYTLEQPPELLVAGRPFLFSITNRFEHLLCICCQAGGSEALRRLHGSRRKIECCHCKHPIFEQGVLGTFP